MWFRIICRYSTKVESKVSVDYVCRYLLFATIEFYKQKRSQKKLDFTIPYTTYLQYHHNMTVFTARIFSRRILWATTMLSNIYCVNKMSRVESSRSHSQKHKFLKSGYVCFSVSCPFSGKFVSVRNPFPWRCRNGRE
jgi:hypothetical protein